MDIQHRSHRVHCKLMVCLQEKGQPVLLIIGTGGGLHDIMWRSPQLAKKYAHTKFADLRKLGGIELN